MAITKGFKPLGGKGYGSIPHLPGSRLGPGDHTIGDGQAAILTVKTRDRHERIIVTEKLDGSNTSVARVGGKIYALGRSGYEAGSSPYEQHQMFAEWVRERESLFLAALEDGQRIVGEWLAQAHGTIYTLTYGPWVCFDVFTGQQRWPWDDAARLIDACCLPTPHVLHDSKFACSIECAMEQLGRTGFMGADFAEGAVWRAEYRGKFNFMAKYVRPEKIDGKYLPNTPCSINPGECVWNWRPAR